MKEEERDAGRRKKRERKRDRRECQWQGTAHRSMLRSRGEEEESARTSVNSGFSPPSPDRSTLGRSDPG